MLITEMTTNSIFKLPEEELFPFCNFHEGPALFCYLLVFLSTPVSPTLCYSWMNCVTSDQNCYVMNSLMQGTHTAQQCGLWRDRGRAALVSDPAAGSLTSSVLPFFQPQGRRCGCSRLSLWSQESGRTVWDPGSRPSVDIRGFSVSFFMTISFNILRHIKCFGAVNGWFKIKRW